MALKAIKKPIVIIEYLTSIDIVAGKPRSNFALTNISSLRIVCINRAITIESQITSTNNAMLESVILNDPISIGASIRFQNQSTTTSLIARMVNNT